MARKKSKRVGRPPSENPEDDRINLRVTTERKERYRQAAQRAGMTLSDWMKDLADKASVKRNGG